MDRPTTCNRLVAGVLFAVVAPGAAAALTLEERVDAQRAIERVYRAHQVGATRPFEEAVPEALLRRKVTTYLALSAALDEVWYTPVTAEMLDRELERMVRDTRMPERLAEIFEALDGDPVRVRECFVRPTLVHRLARGLYDRDPRLHRTARTEAESLCSSLLTGRLDPRREHPSRREIDLRAARSGRRVPTDDEVAAARARFPLRPGEIGPIEEDADAYRIRTVLSDAPDRQVVAVYTVPKVSWDAWWAANAPRWRGVNFETVARHQVGRRTSSSFHPAALRDVQDEPLADSWTPMALAGSAAQLRFWHTAVWTGNAMLVWGGNGSHLAFSYLANGGRYDPATDTWLPISTIAAPEARIDHTAVWAGDRMIVWGGTAEASFATGGRYDPVADVWEPTSTVGAPSARYQHSAVWTGERMVVWGGRAAADLENTGGLYDPVADAWEPTSTAGAPTARRRHGAVWTGSRMVVWGGSSLPSGGRYDPVADTWTPTSLVGAPAPRSLCSAVWTGDRMVVWGGDTGGTILGTGGQYDPANDAWTPTSTVDAPAGRRNHTAVWTGDRMVVWSGFDGMTLGTNTGGRYEPHSDSWTPTTTDDAPERRSAATAVWTGARMLVWGGLGSAALAVTGGLYDPGAAVDADHDGYGVGDGDCDDLDPSVHPGATETCNGVDDDCDMRVDEDELGEDTDGDRVANLCDNCASTANPSQSDLDGDFEGDACDDNDGVIRVWFDEPGRVAWDLEQGYTSWNCYRGDLAALEEQGLYTQEPGGNPLADRACGMLDSWLDDVLTPAPAACAFYLVTGVAEGTEGDLGDDGSGVPRPNANACP